MPDLTGLLNHYGYIVLIVALMLELIAFPLPGEFLMTYCGLLVSQNKLSWGISIAMATIGTVTGVMKWLKLTSIVLTLGGSLFVGVSMIYEGI